MPVKRIGTLLVERGVLTQDQIEQVIARQSQTGRPFGKLAVEMFDVDEAEVWRAWANHIQDRCPRVDVACEPKDPAARQVLAADYAWTHRILPLRFERGRLICATTATDLPNAMAFIQPQRDDVVHFVLTDRHQLEHFIMRGYELDSTPAGAH